MLKLLINLGSDVHLRDFKGRTGECLSGRTHEGHKKTSALRPLQWTPTSYTYVLLFGCLPFMAK